MYLYNFGERNEYVVVNLIVNSYKIHFKNDLRIDCYIFKKQIERALSNGGKLGDRLVTWRNNYADILICVLKYDKKRLSPPI